MFVKVHHAIADGIAGVATLGALLDAGPRRPRRASAAVDAGTAAGGT